MKKKCPTIQRKKKSWITSSTISCDSGASNSLETSHPEYPEALFTNRLTRSKEKTNLKSSVVLFKGMRVTCYVFIKECLQSRLTCTQSKQLNTPCIFLKCASPRR